MSTPIQCGTQALDEMRKSIYAQSSPAIVGRPDLISEIFLIRTPREIELLLMQLNIDIDALISMPIKRCIVNYGDAYTDSPAPANVSFMDGLPMTYFSPGIRAMAKGLQQDSDQYVAYLRQQEDIVDKVSNSATELNRPKLCKSTVEAIQIFDTHYTAYLLDGGKADYLSLIMTEARFGLLGIVAPELGMASWYKHDPRLLIAAIRKKISSAATAIVQPASKVFQSIMMSLLSTYSEDALVTYHSHLNQALEVHEPTMSDIGPKN